jgi:hypothetical protein
MLMQARAQAQAQPSPRSQVEVGAAASHGPARDAQRLPLAQRPLAGPRFAISLGVLSLTVGPLIGRSIVAGASLSRVGCILSEPESAETKQCLAEADREARRAERVGRSVSVSMALVGLALIVTGASRAHAIREARKRVAITHLVVTLDSRASTLRLAGAF